MLNSNYLIRILRLTSNSFQHSAIDVLVEKAMMAIEQIGYKTLCVSSGVGANGYLRDALKKATENSGV